MVRRLDWVTKIYSRVDESVRFERAPSEQIRQQLAFTPFPNEDVARLIDDSNEDLYLFSSDYPHVEGGRNPIGKFESYLTDASPVVKEKFYADNFLRLWPNAAA
jgi:predicted TIM-barrel fold metal-dependent hydrolase